MVRHNNVIPNQHFHKTCWQNHVKTWFNQAARKKRRRLARQKKAAEMAPRPAAGLLRPVVHPPTAKYNYKLRQGRGFTFAELKEAGINKKQARSIGVAVDHRRRNRSAESLQLNSQRLKEYKAALIVFPKKRNKVKAGDSSKEEIASAVQTKVKGILKMPELPKGEEAMVITDEMKSDDVFHKLRLLRADYRLYGIRQKNQLAAKAKE
jgi:large subunit ribosomal protein L13e